MLTMVARVSVLYYKVYLKVKSLKCAKLGNPGAEFNITSVFFFPVKCRMACVSKQGGGRRCIDITKSHI